MLKTIAVGVSTLVLAGGAFMTAQAFSSDGQRLPEINGPLTVQPAGSQTTRPSTTPPTTAGSTAVPCRDDHYSTGEDRHGRGSDDSSHDGCDDLQTVVPRPSVFTDDHGRHGQAEPGDAHGGSSGEAEPGDDHGGSSGEAEPGDDHGGHGEAEPGDDHGDSGSGSDDRGSSGDSGSDDHGGRG